MKVPRLNAAYDAASFDVFLHATDDEVYSPLASPHGYTLAPELLSAWRLQLPLLLAALKAMPTASRRGRPMRSAGPKRKANGLQLLFMRLRRPGGCTLTSCAHFRHDTSDPRLRSHDRHCLEAPAAETRRLFQLAAGAYSWEGHAYADAIG
jgi:hypothetical protein